VLTRRRRSARRALTVNTTAQPRNDASSARKSDTCICQYRWKPLCCRHFRNFASRDADITGLIATRQHRPKARRTDSESQLLAMKKFSWLPASRLIGARQNRFFARIAATDSQGVSVRGGDALPVDAHAQARLRTFDRDIVDDDGASSRGAQMPSLDLSRSLTACGLALPPDDFIT
jgi:hypothetical protein